MTNDASNRAVIVAIDGSDAALDAARWAVHEAELRRLPVRLLHVMTPPLHEERVFGAPDVDRDYGDLVLARAFRVIAEIDRETSVETVLVTGAPTDALIAATRGATMMVLGASGCSALARMMLGSTVMTLSESAECPVVVVRRRPSESTGTVVVGLGPDGPMAAGGDADPVLAEAFRAASRYGVDLLGIRATRTFVDPSGTPVPVSQNGATTSDRMDAISQDFPLVRFESVEIEGAAGTELMEFSGRTRLIVVGHRHGSPLGPTLRSLLRRAVCPIMIVQHS